MTRNETYRSVHNLRTGEILNIGDVSSYQKSLSWRTLNLQVNIAAALRIDLKKALISYAKGILFGTLLASNKGTWTASRLCARRVQEHEPTAQSME